jgi:hypothetical protein
MNQNLNQMFNKYFKGASLGSFLLAGLGYLALNSYYYGKKDGMQLMLATTPSSSINCSVCRRRSTGKGTT